MNAVHFRCFAIRPFTVHWNVRYRMQSLAHTHTHTQTIHGSQIDEKWPKTTNQLRKSFVFFSSLFFPSLLFYLRHFLFLLKNSFADVYSECVCVCVAAPHLFIGNFTSSVILCHCAFFASVCMPFIALHTICCLLCPNFKPTILSYHRYYYGYYGWYFHFLTALHSLISYTLPSHRHERIYSALLDLYRFLFQHRLMLTALDCAAVIATTACSFCALKKKSFGALFVAALTLPASLFFFFLTFRNDYFRLMKFKEGWRKTQIKSNEMLLVLHFMSSGIEWKWESGSKCECKRKRECSIIAGASNNTTAMHVDGRIYCDGQYQTQNGMEFETIRQRNRIWEHNTTITTSKGRQDREKKKHENLHRARLHECVGWLGMVV